VIRWLTIWAAKATKRLRTRRKVSRAATIERLKLRHPYYGQLYSDAELERLIFGDNL
jgi:hypothetical protein